MELFDIGFLGYGRMAGAISGGLNDSGLIPFGRQLVSGRNRARLNAEAERWGLAVAGDNRDLVRRSAVVVLGVKPRQAEDVLEEVRADLTGRLVISLAAGVNLDSLRRWLPPDTAVVRSMPNVAALVGRGATLICAPGGADPKHLARAREIFESVGLCLELEEKLFDAASALSGSGPAYFFSIMEALTRGAARLGLPWDTARILAVQTALGAAETAARRPGQSLADLRDMVTSPGGTTAEALLVLEKGGLGGLLQEAMAAAKDKSENLL